VQLFFTISDWCIFPDLPDEHAIIPSNTLAEGERDKIIQTPSNNAENSAKTADMPESGIKPVYLY
jgi:hypothetical protein